MPSFDIVSKVDIAEVTNAIDQTKREINTRFDFKGVDADIVLEKDKITISAPSAFQVKQVDDILRQKLIKRSVDIAALDYADVLESGQRANQDVTVRQGIDTEKAKKIVKLIKAEKLKVQAAIQGEQVRVTGKKRDDLQTVIAYLRDQELGLPLQFENFRD